MTGYDIFLWVVNVVSFSTLIFTLIYGWRRRRQHKLYMLMLRMNRMTPVAFIRAKGRRAKWVALGTEPNLGYIIGSGMSFDEEMAILQAEVKKIEDSL